MVINDFRGDYYFLSNFYPSYVEYEGDIYPTSEHAFQAAKSTDVLYRNLLTTLSTPDLAKYYGRRVELRPDWEQIKDGVMYDILKDKFSREPNRTKLLDTGDSELVEGNVWHDNYWGSCKCKRCNNKGHNKLGKTLMKIRNELMLSELKE